MSYFGNKDFKYSVAQGNVNGASTVNKFGYNDDVDTGAEEIIGSFGGTFTIMTSDDTLELVSNDANDNSAGTGARTVFISGVNSAGTTVSETVTMNGVTPATTSNSYAGINRAYVVSSGSNDGNIGRITISDSLSTFGTQAMIQPDIGVTQQLIFHTQVSKKLLLDWLFLNVNKLSGGSSPKVTIRGYSYSRVIDTTFQIFRVTIDTSVDNTVELNPSQPFVLGGREVIYFTAETDTNNTFVKGRFSGIEL